MTVIVLAIGSTLAVVKVAVAPSAWASGVASWVVKLPVFAVTPPPIPSAVTVAAEAIDASVVLSIVETPAATPIAAALLPVTLPVTTTTVVSSWADTMTFPLANTTLPEPIDAVVGSTSTETPAVTATPATPPPAPAIETE